MGEYVLQISGVWDVFLLFEKHIPTKQTSANAFPLGLKNTGRKTYLIEELKVKNKK